MQPMIQPETGSQAGQCKLIYILNLVSLVFGVTALVAVVMAYVYRKEADSWLATHYRFQIRTFWIGALYGVAGLLLTPVLIGFLLLLLATLWWIIRAVKGLSLLDKGQAHPDPASWWL
ncbi:DUF4870 family protein [Pontibacter sp. JAM-7]|uniref:DUF4870 family protein n=1 Tax=Pontibacter sp. JAM-7 TaxID=3366581 RepID=UPI003AF7083D